MNLRELIGGVKDYQVEAIGVPEWNTTVHLREITVADRPEVHGCLHPGTVDHGEGF